MLVIFYPSYSAMPRKQSGIAGLTCFLPCISFTCPYECPFKFAFNYEHRKMLDRDQCCRVAVEPLEFCFSQETSGQRALCAGVLSWLRNQMSFHQSSVISHAQLIDSKKQNVISCKKLCPIHDVFKKSSMLAFFN